MKQISPKRTFNRNYHWYSTPARKLFCPDAPENIDVLDVVNEHIDIFEKALEGEEYILVTKSGVNKYYLSAYDIK